MRKVIMAVLLMCLLFGDTLVFAGEHPISETATREATRLAHRDDRSLAARAAASAGSPSGGHPVLIGAIIGAGAGAVLGAVGSSCSATPGPANAAPCGTRYWMEGALLGAGLGAGLGTLVGLAVKALKD